MTPPADAVDGRAFPVRALYEYGRCTSSVTPLTDAADGGTLPVCSLYEYGRCTSSAAPLRDAVMVEHFHSLHCRNMVEVSHAPLLLSVKNGFRYLNVIKDDMKKGGKLTS